MTKIDSNVGKVLLAISLVSVTLPCSESYASGGYNLNPFMVFRKRVNVNSFNSGLPIFSVETDGHKEIQKKSKIHARVNLVNHGKDQINSSEDRHSPNISETYDANIHRRGQSSDYF